jgi:phosphate-selective porin OprO/OprP
MHSNVRFDLLNQPNFMNRFPCRKTVLTALLMIITASGSVCAQEDAETALEEASTQIENEQIEAAKDLRDSVHENLESVQENAQTSEELKVAQDAIQTAQDQQEATQSAAETTAVDVEATPGSPDQVAEKQQTEKKSFVGYLQAIPVYLQSVPERVPFIRDRGLIFFGRAELDFAYYSSGILSDDTGFRVRSLRAGLAKAFKHNLSMKAEIDLTDGESNFADLYIRHQHKRWGTLTAGNQRVAQTLVNQTSRISRTFMEEPLPAEAFGLGRRLALGWDMNKPKGGLHLTAFGPDLNSSIGDSGFAGRIYLNPTRSRFSVFHVGASLVSEDMSRKTRFYSHPESRVTSERLVDTGIYDDVTQQYIGAIEIAGAKDSFMIRGEFFRAKWNRHSEDDPVFKGFYAQASWVLTGESFNYTQGKFLRIRPKNPHGAWEVAVRYSQVDLNDKDIKGGEEKNLSVGVNWYAPANQFRVLANLIFVRTDVFAGDQDPTILQMRAQFHW